MNEAPRPPEAQREDVEQASGGPVEREDVEGGAEAGGDQAGAVSPELGPGSR